MPAKKQTYGTRDDPPRSSITGIDRSGGANKSEYPSLDDNSGGYGSSQNKNQYSTRNYDEPKTDSKPKDNKSKDTLNTPPVILPKPKPIFTEPISDPKSTYGTSLTLNGPSQQQHLSSGSNNNSKMDTEDNKLAKSDAKKDTDTFVNMINGLESNVCKLCIN